MQGGRKYFVEVLTERASNEASLSQDATKALHTRALGEVASARRCIIGGGGGLEDQVTSGEGSFLFLACPTKIGPAAASFPPASASQPKGGLFRLKF